MIVDINPNFFTRTIFGRLILILSVIAVISLCYSFINLVAAWHFEATTLHSIYERCDSFNDGSQESKRDGYTMFADCDSSDKYSEISMAQNQWVIYSENFNQGMDVGFLMIGIIVLLFLTRWIILGARGF